MEEPLTISIVGAGLAGVAASILLSRQPNTSVKLYERSPKPREAGGTIGITPNAEIICRDMMKECADKSKLDRILYRGTTATSRHWKTREPLLPPLAPKKDAEDGMKGVGNVNCLRRHMHEVLLGEIDESDIRGGMRALGLKVLDDGVECTFENGETIKSDLVIVADGIRSRLRDSLGLQAEVKFSGVVEYMEVVPKEQVAHIPNLPTSPSMFVDGKVWIWISQAGPDNYGIIISTVEDVATAGDLGWSQEGGIERLTLLRNMFSHWNQVVVDFLAAMTSVSLFPVYRGEWLEDLAVGGRVALIGDAAHPTGGAYSAGAGLSFCDVQSLTQAMDHVRATSGSLKVPVNLARALSLYSQTRCKFLARVFASIKADAGDRAAMIELEREEDRMGMWADKAVGSDLTWLRYHDVGEEFKKVLQREGKVLA